MTKMLCLEVMADPDQGLLIPVPAAGAVLGRGSGCDISLSHGSVSRRHCRIAWQASGWTAEDLGSSTGTTVNGMRTPRATLRPGDELMLGRMPLRVIAAPEDPESNAVVDGLVRFDCICGKHYGVKDALAGRTVPCKGCGRKLKIPPAGGLAAAPSAPASEPAPHDGVVAPPNRSPTIRVSPADHDKREWFSEAQPLGMTYRELQEVARAGRLRPSDTVWKQDLPYAVEAGDIEGLEFVHAPLSRASAERPRPAPVAPTPSPEPVEKPMEPDEPIVGEPLSALPASPVESESDSDESSQFSLEPPTGAIAAAEAPLPIEPREPAASPAAHRPPVLPAEAPESNFALETSGLKSADGGEFRPVFLPSHEPPPEIAEHLSLRQMGAACQAASGMMALLTVADVLWLPFGWLFRRHRIPNVSSPAWDRRDALRQRAVSALAWAHVLSALVFYAVVALAAVQAAKGGRDWLVYAIAVALAGLAAWWAIVIARGALALASVLLAVEEKTSRRG